MKILIAEDDYASRNSIRNFLKQFGDCDITIDGMEASDAYLMALEDGNPYDLVCLDVMMPVMDGYQALESIDNIHDFSNATPNFQITLCCAFINRGFFKFLKIFIIFFSVKLENPACLSA